MSIEDLEEKKKKINNEVKRLTLIYADIEKTRRLTIKGLIRSVAFLRVSMEYLEQDIIIFGYTEMFSQGDQDPYERKRPSVDIYNQMNSLYQKATKQLTDLLPKEAEKPPEDDGFGSFLNDRN